MLLHRLVYGSDYRLAVFLIDVAGGLPDALANGVPWRLSAKTSAFVPSGATATIPYRRRVGVGHAEVAAERSGEPTPWPGLPVGVSPLALSVTDVADERNLGGRTPLVLRNDETFSILVRPPAVAREVAERWARDEPELRRVLRDARDQGLEAPTFDDPATDGCVIELEEYNPQTLAWVTKKAVAVTFDANSRRARWRRFVIGVGPDYDVTDHLVIPPPGDASRIVPISVYVAVRPEAVDRFEVYAGQHGPEPYLKLLPNLRANKRVLAPERFVVEIASPRLPTMQELARAFRIGGAERRLELSIATPAGLGGAFAALARVEIERLEWVYQGIPRPWPEGASPGWPDTAPANELAAWESDALEGLGELDLTSIPVEKLAHRALLVGRTCRAAVDDYSTDVAGRYLKYRLRAFSRYAGLAKKAPESLRRACVSRSRRARQGRTGEHKMAGAELTSAMRVPHRGCPPC